MKHSSVLFTAILVGGLILLGFASDTSLDVTAQDNGMEVVVDKNFGFVLNGCGAPIPEQSSTVQRKNGEVHMWTVLYQAPDDAPCVPDRGVVRYNVGWEGNTGTLTVASNGKMISKFVSNRGK